MIRKIYKYIIKTPGGSIEYNVPIFKTQQYTLDEIFEKNLLLLIPFYIFSRESELSQYEKEPAKLEMLKEEYRIIIERLDKLVQNGKLSDFDRTTLLETAQDVINEIAKKYQNVLKGVNTIMGGPLLETNARRIKNEGIAEGRAEGRAEGKIEGVILMCRDLNLSDNLILEKLQEIFSLSKKEANKYLERL